MSKIRKYGRETPKRKGTKMNEINFKSIEEINCILTSDEFKKGMEEVEKRNKELLESTKVDYEAMNQRFTV